MYLKHINKSSPEVEIGQYLSSDALRDDPRNHCLPVLDVLEDPKDPEHVILVIPWLRRIDSPEPASVRECVDFVNQTLEVGAQYLIQSLNSPETYRGLYFCTNTKLPIGALDCSRVFPHIIHYIYIRDCAWGNIMMDGRRLYPLGWHPQEWEVLPNGKSMKRSDPSRTAVGGVRYYFIDFGISTKDETQVLGVDGQEPAPELSNDVPYDPFKLDVYILGMAYRHFLVEVSVIY